jgi:hypothetical protein
MSATEKKKSIWKRKLRWPRPIAWFFDLVFSRKMMRLYVFASACCITLIIAFYTIENIRGSLAWSRHVEELKAAGISTDYRDYIPPEIPDEVNLAKIPMFAAFEYERIPSKTKRTPWDLGEVKWKDKSWGPLKELSIYYRSKGNNKLTGGTSKAHGDWRKSTPFDLETWQIYYQGTNAFELNHAPWKNNPLLSDTNIIERLKKATNSFPFPKQPGSPADDVLMALKKYDSTWRELKTASTERPQMRFPLHYDELFACLLPHLSHLKSFHQYGKLRATAEISSGRHEEATETIRMMMQINNGIRNETFYISHLVRIADIYLGIHPIWEGIHRHAFKPEDLKTLSSVLENVNLLAELPSILRMECSVFAATMDVMEEHRHTFYRYFGTGSFDEKKWPGYWGSVSYMNFAPRGWFKQNMLFYSKELRDVEKLMTDVIELKPNAILNFESHLKQSLEKPITTHNVIAKQLYIYKNEDTFYKTLTAENVIRIVRTAIALEQYYLTHQAYPAGLESLVPTFLNEILLNLYSGQSFEYRVESPDRFKLHAPGWGDSDGENETGKTNYHGEVTWRWPEDLPLGD